MINETFLDVNYSNIFSTTAAEMDPAELVDFVTYCWAKNYPPSFALLKQWRRAYPEINGRMRRVG